MKRWIALILIAMMTLSCLPLTGAAETAVNIQFRNLDDTSGTNSGHERTVSSVYTEGTGGVKWAYTADTEKETPWYYVYCTNYNSVTGVDITGATHMIFDLYVEDMSKLTFTSGDAGINLSDNSGSWNSNAGRVTKDNWLGALKALKNGWNHIVLPIDAASATTAFVNRMRLYNVGGAAQAGFYTVLDDIRFVNQAYLDSDDYANTLAAKDVIAAISALTDSSSADEVQAVSEAYTALTSAQRKLVTNFAVLEALGGGLVYTAEAVNSKIDQYLTQISLFNDCDNEVVDGTTLLSYRNASALTMEMETENVTQGTAAAKFIKKRANDDDLPMLFRTLDTLEISDYSAISFDVYVSETMTVLGTDSSAWANVRFQAEHVDSMDTGWIAHIDWPGKISSLKAGEWVTVTLDIPSDKTGTFRQISIRPGNLCFSGAANDYLLMDNVRLTPKEATILNWDCAGVEDAVLELKAMYDSLSDTEKAKVIHTDYLIAWAQTANQLQGPAVAELVAKIDALATRFGVETMFNDCENHTEGGTEIIANTNSGAWSFEMVTDNVSQGATAAKYTKKSSADADLPMIVRSSTVFTNTDYDAVTFDLYVSEGMTVGGTSTNAWAVIKLQIAWDNSSDAGAICETSFKTQVAGLKAGQWNAVTIPLPDNMTKNNFKQICLRIGNECLTGAAGDYVILDNVSLAYSDAKIGSFAVGSGYEEDIKTMKAEYDALTDAQKDAVTNSDLLMCWVAALEEAEATLAGEVVDLIDAIGTVHIFSGDAIDTARSNYDKLSAAKKEEVTNYQALVDAESALAEMKSTGNYVLPEAMQAKPVAGAGGTVLSTCDSTDQVTVSGAQNVVYPTWNNETFIAYEVPAGELIQIKAPVIQTAPVDVSAQNKEDLSLRMSVYISDAAALRDNGQFEITSSGRPDVNELHWETKSVTLQDGWNVLYLDFKDGVTTVNEVDLSAVNYLRFYYYGDADLIMAFDEIAVVNRIVPQFNEDFAQADALAKWESESALALENQILKAEGNNSVTVATSAYSVALTQPSYTPIEFDLQASNAQSITFALVDQNGKKATLELDVSKLTAGEFAHYMVVPMDMTLEAGFTFDLAKTAMLTVTGNGEITVLLDNITTNVRSGKYWRDWVYNYSAEPGDFSIAVIPDIQELTAKYPQKLQTIMQWIADNKEKENIQFAIDVGDVTWNGHQGSAGEFQTAANAFKILQDAGIDYSISYGNHDYQSGRNTSLLNQYFPLSTISTFDSYGGVMTEGKVDNLYYCFEVQGIKYMVVALEFDPLPDTIAWANEVIAAHPDYNVIISTHNYMNNIYGQYSYTGENLWPNLVSKHENVFMVICGHDCITADPGSMNFRVDQGEKGNTVYQVMANSQDIDADRGGVGLLLMMRFTNGGRTIDFNYFSPVNDGLAYKEVNQFSVTLPEGQLIVDENAGAAAAVDALIEQLPAEITTADETAITEARTAYNALTEEQQQLVKELAKLEQAEADLVLAKQSEADKAAAKAVEEQIDALTGEDEAAITAARAAYDALSDAQKALVTNLAKLEQLENPVVETPAYGDVNGDDAVDAKDALMILQAAVDKITLIEEQTVKADVNGDGDIDAKDALLVLQKAVEKIEKFPVEQ